MIKKFFIKEYLKFLKTTVIGKVVNKMTKPMFITGFDPNGKEFYKMTSLKSINSTFRILKEGGFSELDEHKDFEGVQARLYDLGRTRRSRQ